MRSLLFSALLLASLALPAAAHATSFVLTPVGGTAITFTLTGAPSNTDPPFYAEFVNVPTSSGPTNIYVYDPGAFISGGAPPIDLGINGIFNATYVGAKLFTGSVSSPQFLTGLFTLADSATGARASLVIGETAPPVLSATPEPSSLALLGTGVLGLAGAARRRFLRA